MSRMPTPSVRWQPPSSFAAGAQALRTWLDSSNDPNTTPDPAISKMVLAASQKIDADCQTERNKLLESVALQRLPAASARVGLDTLAWANGAVQHAWHLIDSLQAASGSVSAAADNHPSA